MRRILAGTAIAVAIVGTRPADAQAPHIFDRTTHLTKLSLVADAQYDLIGAGFYSEYLASRSHWDLENADVEPSVRTTGIESSRMFDQDEGVDNRGLWAMTYRRCGGAARCQLYEQSKHPSTTAIVESPLVVSTGDNRSPSIWGDHLAFVRHGRRTDVVRVRSIGSGAEGQAERAPGATQARVTAIDLRYPLLAVAWRWRTSDRVHTRIDLVDLAGSTPATVVAAAGGRHQSAGELISPTLLDGSLIYALGGARGRFFRFSIESHRVRSIAAPAHLTAFAVSPLPAGGEKALYQTAVTGGGAAGRCRSHDRSDGCRLWAVQAPDLFGGP